ncbi:hypothetical protein LVISKB_0030 [Levilactobacillus brevis KB290]|jgi:hypothetical protein|uniref:Uncharacterized protein n=1 Tax=Levilactobacillus brevis KB290 TaxID=1001583 RepID=M5ABC2_LEVBR|nr:hypothetical protein LVISKB_0030 [Levilactobacillus brevis KB290]
MRFMAIADPASIIPGLAKQLIHHYSSGQRRFD